MMAEKSSFFNSVNGDRIYDASEFARYFNKFITNGYFPLDENSLKVVEESDMTVNVRKGAAYINGYMYENTDNLLLTLDNSDGVLNRIDRIVIRLDLVNRVINAAVKKGAPSSSPVAPNLQRDSDVFELGIADVYVAAGSVSITGSNITDQRGNNLLCGAVNNLFAVQNVDATSVQINDPTNNYDASNLEGVLDELRRPLNIYRLELDPVNSVFKRVEMRRADGSLYQLQVLSDLVNSNYTVQTITRYATNGTTVVKTDVFDLTYDANGNLQNEVRR